MLACYVLPKKLLNSGRFSHWRHLCFRVLHSIIPLYDFICQHSYFLPSFPEFLEDDSSDSIASLAAKAEGGGGEGGEHPEVAPELGQQLRLRPVAGGDQEDAPWPQQPPDVPDVGPLVLQRPLRG